VFDFTKSVFRVSAQAKANQLLITELPYHGSRDPSALHSKAEEIVNDLCVESGKLGVKSLFDVQYRTGKTMQGSFYLISIGF
jgi:hypothetical protein